MTLKNSVIRTFTLEVTPDQKRVVSLLSKGKTVKEVAKEIKVNLRTLEARLDSLRFKHGCKNNVELVADFVRNKLID